MQKQKYHIILEKIAQQNSTTVSEVRKEILSAMEEAQNNPDPAVQSIWAAIPRKGKQLTLEEFLDYLIGRTNG